MDSNAGPDSSAALDRVDVTTRSLFQRSLDAHLPYRVFEKLRKATVLVAGMGGGSNIAELLARKGIGRFILADPDGFEPHNIRQRGSALSTRGRPKVDVMRARILDINPHAVVTAVPSGITQENVWKLVTVADVIVDMIDFHGLTDKVNLYRAARAQGKTVVTAPSVVNGAVLYVFTPGGPTFEDFFDYAPGLALAVLGSRFLKRLIPRFPVEAPESMYRAAARGERTIPLDAVGVDQAAVLAVAAVENLVLGRRHRVVVIPRGIQVDVSDPAHLAAIVDYSRDFR